MRNSGEEYSSFHKTQVVGLGVFAEVQLRGQLRLCTPSEPWIDAQIVDTQYTNEHGEAIVRRMHDRSAFPPGGAKTAMVRCKICGIFNPPNAIEDGACLDHREDGEWGRSPSAVAIEMLRYYHNEGLQLELAPCSEKALLRLIKRHKRDRAKSGT